MIWESFKGPGCASIALGDIHTLHPVVPTLQIIRCLMWALPDTPKTAKLDFVFINGDFFERLQSFNHPDVHLVIKWVRYFLNVAKKYGIKVRVLEGTPSHDWKQNLIFKTLNDGDDDNDGIGIGADLKYVDQIHIEYVEEHDMHILYVPDLKVDASDMWRQILDKMRLMDIDEVDYTLVHGAFHHQVPKVMHSSPHIHNADQFADITRHHVFANHIHTPSVYRNILGGGSLDCMRHGEEHDKGYMYSWVTEHAKQHEFRVNPIKTQFKQINLTNKNARECMKIINETLEYGDRLACIKIIANKADEIYHIGPALKNAFPLVKFTYDVPDKPKKDAFNPKADESLQALTKVTLTKDNLKSELLRIVDEERPELLQRSKVILNEVISNQSKGVHS